MNPQEKQHLGSLESPRIHAPATPLPAKSATAAADYGEGEENAPLRNEVADLKAINEQLRTRGTNPDIDPEEVGRLHREIAKLDNNSQAFATLRSVILSNTNDLADSEAPVAREVVSREGKDRD